MAKTIGDELKQAREQRGLSIDQASQVTHIRAFYLVALENNRREDLPSNVQGRGFLRLYASMLELPVAPLLAAWDGNNLLDQSTFSDTNAVDIDSNTPEDNTPATTDMPLPVEPPPPEPVFFQESESVEDSPEGSQVIFREIGQALKNQREGLGLTLVEVERYTRLRQHYIIALEEGRMDQLPSPVQGRGMLSNYAAFLNMDEEKLLLRFAEGLQTRRIERLPKPDLLTTLPGKKRPARQAALWRRFLTPDLLFGVVVVVIILFFVLWTAARINAARTAQVQPTPPDISEVLLTPLADQTQTPGTPTAKAATSVAGAATGNGTDATPNPNSPSTLGETSTPHPEQVQTAEFNQSNGTPVIPGVTPTIPPINNDPLQIYIIASQRAYLKVLADDKIKFLGRTVPGNAYAFSGSKRIELLTGDGAALQLFYNQRDLGVLGSDGQVVSYIFSSAGMFTPTAAFTPTPTATKPVTATPLPSPTPRASPTITPYIPEK